MRRVLLLVLGLAVSCKGADPPSTSERASPTGPSAEESATPPGPVDAGGDGAATEEGLPFDLVRPPAGDPVSASDLAAITDKYLSLLAETRYFHVVDERVHGWPESDPQKRYWYGTWWSGCGLDKVDGKVTFQHVDVGADNTGIPTSFYLEGVCLAHRLWPSAKLERLTRRMIRGFNAFVLAMKRSADDGEGVLMARTIYPPSVAWNEDGREAFINYEPDRPGIDSYTQYVHVPTNPQWGDVWIKNWRSKDDIGHMFRAIATATECASGFGPEGQADLAALRDNYSAWAKRVEADGWAIATLNTDGDVVMPNLDSTMSRYHLEANAECTQVLTLRLFGGGAPGTLECGNGIHPLEAFAMKNEHNGEIVRSYHVAAARHALLSKQNVLAKTLLEGLIKRMDDGMDLAEDDDFPAHMPARSLVKLLVEAANAGAPLTSRDVRWIHRQIEAAFTSYVTNGDTAVYRVFDPGTPDGSYDFTPDGEGFEFNFFSVLAGTCSSRFWNPTSAPLLDCAKVKAWSPPP